MRGHYAWELITAYCSCGWALLKPAGPPHTDRDTVVCPCGQVNVAQFWRQQLAPHQEPAEPARRW